MTEPARIERARGRNQIDRTGDGDAQNPGAIRIDAVVPDTAVAAVVLALAGEDSLSGVDRVGAIDVCDGLELGGAVIYHDGLIEILAIDGRRLRNALVGHRILGRLR